MLVPLYWDPDLVCLLTERVATLRQHGGEVSFPGGKQDPGESLEQTALREAREELGLERIAVLGTLSTVPVYTSAFRLVPFVAHIDPPPHLPNPAEVAREVPLRIAQVLALPTIDAIAFDMWEQTHLSPVFETGGRPLFGATAHSFFELLVVLAPLFGVPVPPRRTGRYAWDDLSGTA